ncbi:hypothetical protein JW865_01780 [Candidatus Bathyarchaeota archaeon]|nr:hypothetical protein [Candidatus Bathyarchaeota archaeon]
MKTNKLVFKPKDDFKFIAAYEAYSKGFDKAKEENQLQLNELIQKLYEDEIDYQNFYYNVNQFISGTDDNKSFRRARIEGQRKQEYQKSERKRGRNERYRG